jgi:cytochrome c-type biogenesis protein
LGTSRAKGTGSWALLAILVAALVATGYGVFVFFIKSFSPTAGTLSLLIFAVIAGVATFFSPCSFPLMPGYLTRHLQVMNRDSDKARRSVVSNGLAAAGGVFLFDLILGLAIVLIGSSFAGSLGISGSSPNLYVRIFRGTVGAFLVLLGILNLKGTGIFHNDSLTSIGKRLMKNGALKPSREMFAYGFAYVSVGIGCAGPILSGLPLFALSFGGAVEASAAFLLFAITMAGLMIGVSLLVAVSPSTLTGLKNNGPRIKKIASFAQVAVGIFLAFAAYYNSLFVQLLFPR